MAAPVGFSLHASGYWYRNSDQSGPYTFDGTNMVLAVPSGGIMASSGNVANASAVATLAAVAGKTTFISGLVIAASGATAASVVSATVAGLAGGTMTIPFAVPVGALVGAAPLVIQFNPPIPASAVNTAIVVTLPALGAGNTNAAVSALGYQQ